MQMGPPARAATALVSGLAQRTLRPCELRAVLAGERGVVGAALVVR